MTSSWGGGVVPLSMRPGPHPDQVPRREAFEAAHPDVKILEPAAPDHRWVALIDEGTVPGDARNMVISRYELADLLDELGALFPP